MEAEGAADTAERQSWWDWRAAKSGAAAFAESEVAEILGLFSFCRQGLTLSTKLGGSQRLMQQRKQRTNNAEIGRMVEESTSAEICRVVAELTVAALGVEGGVEAAADEDAVWAVVLAGRARAGQHYRQQGCH